MNDKNQPPTVGAPKLAPLRPVDHRLLHDEERESLLKQGLDPAAYEAIEIHTTGMQLGLLQDGGVAIMPQAVIRGEQVRMQASRLHINPQAVVQRYLVEVLGMTMADAWGTPRVRVVVKREAIRPMLSGDVSDVEGVRAIEEVGGPVEAETEKGLPPLPSLGLRLAPPEKEGA